MAYSIEPQIFTSFKGIREYNGVNSNGAISAIKMSNVELVQTELGSATGIKSMDGNVAVYELPSGYSAKGIFKSKQDNIVYKLIYGENETKGTLFYVNLANELEILVDDLSLSGKCNGLTMSSSAYDVFVFTNGIEVKTICFGADSSYGDRIKTINAVDYLGRQLHWLSMTEWNGFLVVASEYGVHSSHQNDIYTWNDDPQDVADSWYIDFSKKVSAVVSFTNGLYIFTQDDISFLNATPNDTNSSMKTSAMNGCFSFESIIKHDTYLFFYDDKQKNIYYLTITDTGQTRPTGPAAKEIQSKFKNVKSFKMFSCIYGQKNEIWCLINDEILIFDYTQQEWIQRSEPKINAVVEIDNAVYSAGDNGKISVENVNLDFDGVFYPSVYQTTYINIGTNTNLKKQKTPLLLVVNDNYTNDFYVELSINGKAKNPKRVKVTSIKGGVYYDPEQIIAGVIPDNMVFGKAVYSADNIYSKKVVIISTPQTWYTMGIKIYTNEPKQGFYITSMELKNIKGKTKTKGR